MVFHGFLLKVTEPGLVLFTCRGSQHSCVNSQVESVASAQQISWWAWQSWLNWSAGIVSSFPTPLMQISSTAFFPVILTLRLWDTCKSQGNIVTVTINSAVKCVTYKYFSCAQVKYILASPNTQAQLVWQRPSDSYYVSTVRHCQNETCLFSTCIRSGCLGPVSLFGDHVLMWMSYMDTLLFASVCLLHARKLFEFFSWNVDHIIGEGKCDYFHSCPELPNFIYPSPHHSLPWSRSRQCVAVFTASQSVGCLYWPPQDGLVLSCLCLTGMMVG